LTVTDAGTGIVDDTYAAQGLTTTSGSGANATADIEVSGGSVVSISPVAAGTGYKVGDTISASLPSEPVVTPGTGEALTASFAGGTGLDASDGTVSITASEGVLSAGIGADAEFDVTITSGEVTAVAITAGGTGYEAGDEITFDPTVVLGSTTGTDLVVTIDTVDEDTTSAGPSVTITAEIATIS